MKEYFFITFALLVPLALLGWFLYALGKAFASMYDDWKLGKELDDLRADAEARRGQKHQQNEQRLAGGCEHDFEAHAFGFPPGTCSKCGLEKERPSGGCDHVWRSNKAGTPKSTCEKCGKTYSLPAGQGGVAR